MIKSKTTRLKQLSLSRLKLIIISIAISTITWQCVTPPDFLGGELMPTDDFLSVKIDSTFKLSAYTETYDSLNTAGFTNGIAGEYWDEVFGKTRSSFLSQLYLSKTKHKFGKNPVLDSAFLYLTLSEKVGDIPVELSVFELADSLQAATPYNGLGSIEKYMSSTQIGTTAEPYNGDSTVLKIPLDPTWVVNKLISPTLADTTIMYTQQNFLKHFYGIYVAPKSSLSQPSKGLYYFNVSSITSRMMLYYKNDEEDSLKYQYSFSSYNGRFNHFQHDFSFASPDFGVRFNAPGSQQDSVFYVKGFGAVRGVINLDDISKWSETMMPISINRAELRIELEESQSLPKDTFPSQLFLYTEIDGKDAELTDSQINNTVFGGKYSKSKKYYSFNITYHVQEKLKNPDKSGKIFVEPKQILNRADGAVLRSGSHSQRMKLIITYTKL